MHGLQLLTNKNDLRDVRWTNLALPNLTALSDDAVLLRIDEFALTANNITYAVAGKRMGYWNFFPAPEGWGRIPVWGFATVVASNCNAVSKGERLYGYFPMGSHLLIEAGRIKTFQLSDISSHRRELPKVYNQLARVSTPPNPPRDAAQMLFRPLFMTSFILNTFIASSKYFGASDVILTSASSKTALGLAMLLARRSAVRVVGLTSTDNVGFVQRLGCYDSVVTYEQIASLDAAHQTLTVDVAGNGGVLTRLHNHFADNLRYSCLVGATHWEDGSRSEQLAGPKPVPFFAPDHIQNTDWGPRGLEKHFSEAWQALAPQISERIRVERSTDPAQIEAIYQRQLAGQAAPDIGYLLTIQDKDKE